MPARGSSEEARARTSEVLQKLRESFPAVSQSQASAAGEDSIEAGKNPYLLNKVISPKSSKHSK